ncbi:hypothetical protein LPJ68_001551 [Coemansia sp. RSA 1086]|nr:hypothetical protein LPJ68_001551 [Coemansia sp. RSA 1086]
MRRAAKAQSTLRKPFKSPARKAANVEAAGVETAGAETGGVEAAGTNTLCTPSLERKRPVPSSAPPFRLSTPLSKRPRLATPASCRKPSKDHRLAISRDSAVNALLQEKQALQQQLAQLKEETVLLERACNLKEKDDAQVVSKLMAKWQIACAAAADDLFVLLKPMMEAHRDAQQMGMAGSQSEQDRAAEQDLQAAEGESQDISLAYMLKQFNIDTDLF